MTRRAKRRRSAPPQPRCVLDSGALTGLVGGSQRARAWLAWLAWHRGALIVPTPVLCESTTGDGGRDAEVNRILGVLSRLGGVLSAPDEATARRAGALRFRARADDGVDALVAAAAVGDGSPCVLLTTDPGDLERLLANSRNVSIRRV